MEGTKIYQNSHLEHSILKFARLCTCKSLIHLNLYASKYVLARRLILTYISPLKIFQVLWVPIHFYYQISHEQSSSKVTFQVLIWNEIARYLWMEKGPFSWSVYFSNSPRCCHGENLAFMALWIARKRICDNCRPWDAE